MKRGPIVSRHLLADKVPFLVAFVLMMVVVYLPNTAISSIIELFTQESGSAVMMVFYLSVIALSLILLVLFERWFYPEYDGSMTIGGMGYGLRLLLPAFVFWAAWTVATIATGQVDTAPPTLERLLQGARPGVNEEVAFRGIAVALLLRSYRGWDNVWVPAIFTAVAFGATHLTDLLDGEALLPVLVNVLFATVMGASFGIVFTLCGSIWPTVIAHSLYDAKAFCVGYTDAAPDWLTYAEVGVALLIMVWLLLVLRRRREETAKLWDTRWHNA